jgi:uncharacterized membrane protein YphA (DoxX/SURF4 family)
VRWLRHPAVYWTVSIALGALFIYASHEKIEAPRAFAKAVYHFRLAGPSAAVGFLPPNLLAVILPWLEAVCGVLLILGVWRREAAVLTGLMLVMFLVALGWAVAHGIDIAHCGCFTVSAGDDDGRWAWLKIPGDLALLAAAVYVAAWPPLRREPQPLASTATVH